MGEICLDRRPVTAVRLRPFENTIYTGSAVGSFTDRRRRRRCRSSCAPFPQSQSP
uniref:Uncharacterized protein n=1 Tax=Anguilla anguilla TaxID=7936 RepID=A0A0E9UVJ9_ANGAN